MEDKTKDAKNSESSTEHTNADDNTPDSSTEEKDKGANTEKVTTLADVVKEASHSESPTEEKGEPEGSENEPVEEETEEPVSEKEEPAESTEETELEIPDEKEEKEKPVETKEKEKVEEKEEEVPFHKHPRWQQVNKELKEAKPLAEQQKHLQTYRQQYNISDEQFSQALEIVALMNNRPDEAKKALRATLENMEVSSGERLPVDLQERVDKGLTDEVTAKELAKLRIETKGSQFSIEKQRKELQSHQENTLRAAVNDWEANKKQTDTAYDKKSKFVKALFAQEIEEFRKANQAEPNATQLVGLAEKAYNEVSSNVKQFVPKPKVRKVLNTNGSSTNTKTEPKTLRDVVFRTARHGRV